MRRTPPRTTAPASTNSAEAVTHAALCRFPRKKLEDLLARYPKLESRLLGMASHELAAAQEQMLLLGRKSAREKILSFLLYRQRHLDPTGRDASVDLPMSRTDIADYLGLTIETVSRTFTALRNEGLIELPNPHHVIFPDMDAVRDAAEAA